MLVAMGACGRQRVAMPESPVTWRTFRRTIPCAHHGDGTASPDRPETWAMRE